MAFAAAVAPQGIEIYRSVAEKEILLVPGDPGVTFTRGDRVAMSGGVAIVATDSLASTVGRVVKTTVCPAATQAFPVPGPGRGIGDLDGAAAKTLIPVEVDVPCGVKVWKAPLNGYLDETVVAYSAASRYIQCTTGMTADDYPNGALVYVYEGPGKGEINVVEDYDHTGGTVELMLVLHRQFNATLTTASKFIVIGSDASANAGRSSILGRMDLYDKDQLDVADGYDDGNFITFMDFMDVANFLVDGAVGAINATYLIAGE